MKTRLRRRQSRKRREEENSRHRRRRLECEVDDFAPAKTKIQIRSGPDAARNGGADETATARLELRRRLDGISSSSPQWAHLERTQTSRSGVDTLQLREVAGQTDPHHQRRSHAGPRQFPRRAHVVSRTRHRAGINIDLGNEPGPAGARRSALWQRRHYRGLPRQIGDETARGKKVETRSSSRGPVVEKSLIADYVVLGGGSAKKFDELPAGIEPGHNRNAFLGGVRLWQIDPRTRRAKWWVM